MIDDSFSFNFFLILGVTGADTTQALPRPAAGARFFHWRTTRATLLARYKGCTAAKTFKASFGNWHILSLFDQKPDPLNLDGFWGLGF